MSVDNSSNGSSSLSPTNNTQLDDNTETDDSSILDNTIVVNEEYITDKQRRVLMATQVLVEHKDPSASEIARTAGVSQTYVPYVLSRYVSREDLPSHCTLGSECISNKSYENLTDSQRRIINERAVNPDATYEETAQTVGVSNQFVSTTVRQYADILAEKRSEACK
jgi:DNA-directed RNA polymerase specialized sigma subunit